MRSIWTRPAAARTGRPLPLMNTAGGFKQAAQESGGSALFSFKRTG